MNLELSAMAEVSNVRLRNVKIGKATMDVEIEQVVWPDNGHLTLRFSCGYTIHIDERGVCLERIVLRPTHDHSNLEQLRIHEKDKTLKWCDTDYPAKDYDIARFDFGPITVSW